ncbi:flagellar biosynthetic protein FliR [Pseudoalteromonas aurantia]|uniref:flagellar biosynthetic protein FliR n=1 Tax=Pseudoalteromonas aurantia TaxID=43654 RepID=UPI001486C414|nr:flagellar biosynthetic protein FliR [Pseudoalteromonas aurantia]
MNISFYVAEFSLIGARLLPFFISSGHGPFQRLPAMVRIVVLIILTLICCFLVQVPNSEVVKNYMLLSILNEFAVGVALFFLVQLPFVAIGFWGRVLDMQIGFGAAGVVDPANKSQEPLLGTIFVLAALAIFYLSGMHITLIKGILFSFERFPIGTEFYRLNLPNMASVMTVFLSVGMLVYIPVILLMWCLDLFMGFVSRTMPQMNIYFVMLPLKIAIGLFLLSIFSVYSEPVLTRLFKLVFFYWDSVFA